jgi:hypothetical protein
MRESRLHHSRSSLVRFERIDRAYCTPDRHCSSARVSFARVMRARADRTVDLVCAAADAATPSLWPRLWQHRFHADTAMATFEWSNFDKIQRIWQRTIFDDSCSS